MNVIDHQLQDILARRVRGKASAGDERILAAALDSSPELRKEAETFERIFRDITTLHVPDPPSNMRASVLSALPGQGAKKYIVVPLYSHFKEAIMDRKKYAALVGIAAVAVAVIIVISQNYPPPAGEESAGTIGGAQKAEKDRSEQMGSGDVVLKNESFQRLLQDDEFQKLIGNPEFQNALSNAAFWQARSEEHTSELQSQF